MENTYNADTDWYMANEVLQSLEDSDNSANGGAYSYILNYVNPRGESTLLYSSDSIGGEGDSKGGKGLHQATSSLEEFFYLERISGGQISKDCPESISGGRDARNDTRIHWQNCR